jgi:hypothetical protein
LGREERPGYGKLSTRAVEAKVARSDLRMVHGCYGRGVLLCSIATDTELREQERVTQTMAVMTTR